MATVQSSYSEAIGSARNGMPANTATCDADSYITEGTDGIGFGIAVQDGASAGLAKLGIATGKFIGVSLRDTTRQAAGTAAGADKYQTGANIAVAYRGDIWVEAEVAVIIGANVSAKTTTGALSSVAAAATQIVIPGARWMSAAAAGGLAIVRLSGTLPSV